MTTEQSQGAPRRCSCPIPGRPTPCPQKHALRLCLDADLERVLAEVPVWRDPATGKEISEELRQRWLSGGCGPGWIDEPKKYSERIANPTTWIPGPEACGKYTSPEEYEAKIKALCHENNKLRKANEQLRAAASLGERGKT